MNGPEAVIERAKELYRDSTFAAVRDWKSRHPGARAVGYLPMYAPRELIHAAGVLPVGVVGNGDIEIIRGDAFFQSYICHLPRSVIELGMRGSLDALDGMIFPSTCDVIRNLSGMWKLLFADKWSYYLDVPQSFTREVGGSFFVRILEEVRRDLAKLAGKPVTDEALRASIALYNENRALTERLYAARRDKPAVYPSSEVYLLMRAGLVLAVDEHNAMLRTYLEAPRQGTGPELDNIRVVVSGSFCEQPPVELIRTLERAGCYIVDDDFLFGTRWITTQVEVGADPLRALVDAFLEHSHANASLYAARGDNGRELVERVRAARADGVVFSAPSFCDPALLDQPMSCAALDAAGIPYTAFKYAENNGQFQVIREQAGTFADSIRLWGEA